MSSVLVSVPVGDAWAHKHTVWAAQRIERDPRHQVDVMWPTHSPYVEALHAIREDFLAGGYDYWLNIDADNPPTRNPLDLIDLGLDVVGCPTPVLHADESRLGERWWYLNALDLAENGEFRPVQDCPGFGGGGLVECDAVGTGCVLIARRVIEALGPAPFFREWKQGRVSRGNDFAFCMRAKRKGFRVWAHFDYPCHHFNEVDLLEVIRHSAAVTERMSRRQTQPAD